jgi:hypothetical protein
VRLATITAAVTATPSLTTPCDLTPPSPAPPPAVTSTRQAWAAALLGLLALACVPLGTFVAHRVVSVDLVRATVVAVCAAFVFGLAGISTARRARFRIERSVSRRGERTLRFARFLVYAGLYVGLVGAIALGFYGVVLALS